MRDCATYQGKVPPKITRVLVFCRKGELQLVRKLQQKYPGKTIVSGTYEFSLLRKDGMPAVENIPSAGLGSSSSPLVILSAPYGTADYLNHLVSNATGTQFQEHLGRPMLDWMNLADGFQASRFFANAERAASGATPFATQVLTDVLDMMLECTPVTLERIVSALNARQAKVLLLRHPARFDHAFASELLERSRLRYLAQAPAGKPHQVNPRRVTMQAALRWSKALLNQEATLEKLGGALENVLEIQAEDLVQQPERELARATEFCGLSLDEDQRVQTVSDYRRPVKGLDAFTLPMKRQLIDRFGVHLT